MGPAQWLNLSDCQSYKKRLAPIIIDFEHVTNFQDSQLIEQGERFTTYFLFKGQSSQKLSWAAGPIVAPKSLEKMGVPISAVLCSHHLRPSGLSQRLSGKKSRRAISWVNNKPLVRGEHCSLNIKPSVG